MKKILFLSAISLLLNTFVQGQTITAPVQYTWQQILQGSIMKASAGKGGVFQTVSPAATTVPFKFAGQNSRNEDILRHVFRMLPDGTFALAITGGGGASTPTPSNLALGLGTATSQPVTNSNGTGFTLTGATTGTAGLLIGTDKAKLDLITVTSAVNLNNLLLKNALITTGTGTKITYDANGLVTGSTNALTSDVLTSSAMTIAGTVYPINTPTSTILSALNSATAPDNTTTVLTTQAMTIAGTLFAIGTPAQTILNALNANVGWGILGNAGTVQATNFLGTTDNVGLSLRTNNVIHQTITAAGNVGFGTNAPVFKAQIQTGTTLLAPTQNGIINTQAGSARYIQENNLSSANDKAMMLETVAGYTTFSSLNDNGQGFVVPTILSMRHSTGFVGFGADNSTGGSRVLIDNINANTSGLRFARLTSASPATTGSAIGVDANGDVVRIAAAAIATIDAIPTDASTNAVSSDGVFDALALKQAVIPFVAKGDLVVGTGAGTSVILPTGTAGQVLVVDATTASGLKWVNTPTPVLLPFVSDAAAATGGIAVGGMYKLAVANIYGGSVGIVKIREL